MKRRRRIVAVAIAMFAPAVVLLFGACGFPEVNFGSNGNEAGSETSINEGSPGDGGPDAVEEGVVVDAIARDDATAVIVDASICESRPPCDCDFDGYRVVGCPADAGFDAKTRPDDCDDLDPLRHPEAGFTEALPPTTGPKPHAGDWNCDNNVEQFTPTDLKCTGLVATGCSPPGGYIVSAVACGVKADRYSCTGPALGTCEAQNPALATQACR